MDNIKYRYSAWKSYQMLAIILLVPIGFPLAVIVSDLKDESNWPIWASVILLGFIAIYFWYKKLYLRVANKDLALEMDSEKLTYYAKKRVIYWKEVLNIDYDQNPKNNIYTISFSMNNANEDMRLSTGFIAGKDKEICESILSYFEKYKR